MRPIGVPDRNNSNIVSVATSRVKLSKWTIFTVLIVGEMVVVRPAMASRSVDMLELAIDSQFRRLR